MKNISVYGTRVDLLNGLKTMIEKVESSKFNSFLMNDYPKCVIGKLIANGEYWHKHQAEYLKEIFNIDVYCSGALYENAALFHGDEIKSPLKCQVAWNEDQMDVIALFTSWVSPFSSGSITKDKWLEKAKKVYNSKMGL